MTHPEFLERQARRYWAQGQQLPLDLFYNMLANGLDVGALEREYQKENDEQG